MGLGRDDAAADVEHRLPRGRHEIEHLVELLVGGAMRLAEPRVAERNRLRVLGDEARLLHVLRDVDDDRAGAPGAGDLKGLFEDAGQVFHVEHEE